MRGFLAALFACVLLGSAPSATGHGSLVLTPHRQPRVAVLLLHQISDSPIESAHGVDLVQRPWISPKQFDALLARLDTEGFTYISLRQALAFFQNDAALPAKPVLITFDDGFKSALTTATPILRSHHAYATMFFEGHATENTSIPGRLDERDLRAMAASGIWTLQSHGWAGHSNLIVDRSGTTSPYWYVNLAWLRSQHRFETTSEFESRVESDLRRMRTRFEPVTGAPITVFAYPSGEFGQNSALPSGADPRTLIEAGHSNATGLTPYLIEALSKAGYTAAFAVSLPMSAHLASRTDSAWTIPRIGVGADFDVTTLEGLESRIGAEYPEVADGHIADAGPLCAFNDRRYVASTSRPVLFTLDDDDRVVSTSTYDALLGGRSSANISALACDAGTIYAVQQAGFDSNPQPYLVRFSRNSERALTLASRVPLPHTMNWLVGLAVDGSTIYGIDDRGSLFDVAGARQLAIVDSPIPDMQRHDRFCGLAFRNGLLFTVDRADNQIVAFSRDGAVLSRNAIDPGIRDLAFDGDRLLASYWTTNFHSMRTYDIVELPHP